MADVYILSNGAIPGQGLPCAAPGLRAYGLRHGFHSNNVQAEVIVTAQTVKGLAARWNAPIEGDASGAIIVDARQIMEFLAAHAPCTVITTNQTGAKLLTKHPQVRMGMDLFSATVLEHRYRGERGANIAELIELKKRSIELADFYFINGSRRLPYYHGWIASIGKDLREIEIPVVNMSLPFAFRTERALDESTPVRFALMGYDQAWAPIVPVLEHMERLAMRYPIEVDVIAAVDYWSTESFESVLMQTLHRLRTNPSFQVYPAMEFERVGRILGAADVFLDLFDNNIERYYSMSTRAIVALSHGVPIVHPSCTELGGLARRYDAGWVVDDWKAGLDAIVEQAAHDRVLLRCKQANACELARQKFNPKQEVGRLLPLV